MVYTFFHIDYDMLFGQKIMPCSCQWKKSFGDQLSHSENTILLLISVHVVALQRHFYIECHEHFWNATVHMEKRKHRNIWEMLVDWLWNSFLLLFVVFQSYNSITRVFSRSQGGSKSLQLCCPMWAEDLQLCLSPGMDWVERLHHLVWGSMGFLSVL